MPFIGVRISWLMAARKRDLARFGGLRLVAGLGKLRLRIAPVGHVAPDALHLEARPVGGGHEPLLPLDPARTARRAHLLRVALVADLVRGRERLQPGVVERLDLQGRAESLLGREPELGEESLVGEGQAAAFVAAQDHVLLRIEQRAVALLVLVELPLQVLELLEAALQAHADVMRLERRRFGFLRSAAVEHEVERDETEPDADQREGLYERRRSRREHGGNDQEDERSGERQPCCDRPCIEPVARLAHFTLGGPGHDTGGRRTGSLLAHACANPVTLDDRASQT
jgi:hypothetical protein